MDDGFQPVQCPWIGKDDFAQLMSIDLTIGSQDRRAKGIYDGLPGGCAMARHLVGHTIGINDLRSQFCQHVGDGTLAGGNVACESDQIFVHAVLPVAGDCENESTLLSSGEGP
jgi:hypothetical protein